MYAGNAADYPFLVTRITAHNAGKCALVVGSSVAVFRVESEALREEEILKHMKILVSIEDVRVAGNAG